MEPSYWHQKWAENNIGFHKSKPHAFLVNYIDRLQLQAGANVLGPLCGKTLDIAWLLSQQFTVTGVELNESAVQSLFAELSVTPTITSLQNLKVYSAEGLQIFVGNIFDVDEALLGDVDAVFDRAALVALPLEMRKRYTKYIASITKRAPQLLITFDYDQSEMAGPPHSVPQDEVIAHYQADYNIIQLHAEPVDGGLKSRIEAMEILWYLQGL